MKKLHSYLLATIVILCCACTDNKPKHIIGVSQCSEDIWRSWQNSEMKMEAAFHEGVELRFTSAYDNSGRQSQQIDSLVESGIDLLIVAPNQLTSVSPAIDRAFDKGIPVIVFERKTDSQKYTAFVSADNYEMGWLMGEYIESRLNGKGNVIEILGLKGSSPADERHKGFTNALRGSDMKVVGTLQGDWSEETSYQKVKQWLAGHKDVKVDYVFGQNDRMAMGARKAFREIGRSPYICGIDGLPGENGGIRLVRDSLLDASYIYPTRGDQLLQIALDILEGKPFKKETMLTSAIVTRDNANVLLLESEEVVRQAQRLERMNQQASTYLHQLSTQRIINVLSVVLIVLMLAFIVISYLYHLQKARLADERNRMEREQLDFYTQVSHELRTPLTLIDGPLEQISQTKEAKEASAETQGLIAILRRNTQQLTDIINKMLDAQTAIGNTKAAMAETLTDLPAETPPLPSAEPSQQANNATILIVDDNADIRAYLRSILQGTYQVNEAADGQQGLALANEIVPDLIISDVMMPVMNGLEFCQRVKGGTATSHIPVILLTARALSQHQIEGYESGADAYITKPFSAELLMARISNLLRSRLQLKNLFGNAEDNTKAPAAADEAPATEREVAEAAITDTFLLKFRDFIEKNMSDSDLNVETIGAELGLSRVQLYRKVKALTGQSPVELLRTARLQKGRQLLQTSGKTISEIAYEVGFTAPSYFTKCFKDEFGISPSDL